MANLAIRGHATRSKEVVEILEMLGGKNTHNLSGDLDIWYILASGNVITAIYLYTEKGFTLEEFLEKFPYKVGDKVMTDDGDKTNIVGMIWDNDINDVFYEIQICNEIFKYPKELLQPYKGETMEERKYSELRLDVDQDDKLATEATIDGNKITPPNNYLIGKVTQVDNGMLVEFVKKQPKYPEAYEEDNYCETLEIKVLGYKVGDVIFTNNTGWIRITNKLWDCYAEEYVYGGIGVLSEQEYNNIRHKDIINKMEADSVIKNMKESITSLPYITANITDKNNCSIKCHDGYEFYDENGNLIGNNIMIIPKKPKCPKTYKDCCEVLMGETDFQDYSLVLTKLSTNKNEENSISPEPPHITLINNFYKLIICRDAYWKIAGEEMGLDKPWKPDWKDKNESKFIICVINNQITFNEYMFEQKILAFPTKEMCDVFYENFKDLIESCKELL